jgi:hypothetical protein
MVVVVGLRGDWESPGAEGGGVRRDLRSECRIRLFINMGCLVSILSTVDGLPVGVRAGRGA